MNTDIETALKNFRTSSDRYRRAERYYKGDHDLAFATEKFKNAFGSMFREFALNLCPAVCDAVRDKLKVREFRVEQGGGSLSTDAWRIWQTNRMGRRSGEVHKEAVKNGDAYVIVWPNARGEATIYPNKAGMCTAVYDEETPGRVLWAAKHWRTQDKRVRLNLFYPDRIEKYISKAASENTLPDAKEFVAFGGSKVQSPRSKVENQLDHPGLTATPPVQEGSKSRRVAGDTAAGPAAVQQEESSVIPNPYGVVPVFHFANNADIGAAGQSELDAAMPVQDALNKSVLDMLVAMEFASYRQRWAAGIEIEYGEDGQPVPPFKAGVDHLWITENQDAKFGDFEAANLEQFLKVKDSFRMDMACVTGTPMYYFMQVTGDFPSGEALKRAESRFIAKVRDRQESFGQVWEDVMAFALAVEGKTDARLFADWEDPAPLSEKEKLENIAVKKELGISEAQALIEAGYGEVDVKRILGEKQASAEAFNAE
jgi:hypothetical protein